MRITARLSSLPLMCVTISALCLCNGFCVWNFRTFTACKKTVTNFETFQERWKRFRSLNSLNTRNISFILIITLVIYLLSTDNEKYTYIVSCF